MFKIFRRKRRLHRDDVVALLADCVLKSGVTKNILESLVPAERDRLGSPSRVEAQLLDLWVVNEALVRSPREIPDSQMQSLVDGYHLSVYDHLLSSGYRDADLAEIQARLRARYSQYGEALSLVLTGDPKGPFGLARVVLGNLFKSEMNDPAVAVALTGLITAALFSTKDMLKTALADSNLA